MSFDKKNQLKNKDDEGKIYTTAKHIFCWLIVWSVSCRGETSLSCLYQGLIIWTFSDWNKKTNRSIGSKLFLSRSNFNPQGAPACHWVSRRFSSPRVHSLLGSSRVSSCSWSDGHVILLWVYYSKWVTLCFTAELRDARTRTGRRGPRCSCGFKSLFFCKNRVDPHLQGSSNDTGDRLKETEPGSSPSGGSWFRVETMML